MPRRKHAPGPSARSVPAGSGSYTRADLEPLSFDDLPLGGEWTTRRRTVSESDIALYAGVAGDFSPLTIEAGHGPRPAPPSLVVAMAIGLGSMDMPVPSVAEWEWLNWRFPHPVHAGDTIFARWTLTQKRPPAHAATSSIVVWRVDVHKLDGSLCAEGEVGAKIKRHPAGTRAVHREPDGAPAVVATSSAPRRRRRRRNGANGHGSEGAGAAATAAPAATARPRPAQAVKPASPPTAPAKRRRRRRTPASQSGGGRDTSGEAAPAASPDPPAPAPVTAAAAHPAQNPIGRVISRLRRA